MAFLAASSPSPAIAQDIVYKGATERWWLTFSKSNLLFSYREGAEHEAWVGEARRTASSRRGVNYSGVFTRYFVAAGEHGSRSMPFELTLRKRSCRDLDGKGGSITAHIKFLPDADGFTYPAVWGCGAHIPKAGYLVNPMSN